MATFRKASKKQSRLRAAIDGPAGAGKTFTALRFATAFGKRIAVINTESGAVEKYLGMAPDGIPFDFDIVELPDFSPTTYTSLIQEAGRLGYDVLIIDSLSHAWAGAGGALELVDKQGGNSFTAWKKITPMHNQLVEAILRSPCHVIATMRSKMEYVMEDYIDPKTGARKSQPKKVGLAPIQRQGMEYEFDLVCDMDLSHTLTVSKTRCPLIDEAVVVKPGAAFIEPVRAWLSEGIEIPADYWAVKPEDLQSGKAAAEEEAQEQRKAEAAAKRRQELIAAAHAEAAQAQEVAPAAPVETAASAATTEAPPTTEPATEPAPFDGGQPAATPASPATPATATASTTTDAKEPVATIQQLQELVSLGQQIGRDAQQISDECKAKFGVGPSSLPRSTMVKLIAAFKKAAEAAKNQAAV